jgi:leucyl-tRNA synthetase
VEDGLCWRCDTQVVQKELTQWFLRITDYAEELLRDLDELEGGWPERVVSMQRNWIGKSIGAEIVFPLERPSRTGQLGPGIHHPAGYGFRGHVHEPGRGASPGG